MPILSGRCYSKVRLENKTAVVTGCNTGIGKETVMDFYKRGAHVIMACRDLTKAETAKKDIEQSCADLNNVGTIITTKLDLNSLTSVRACAKKILDTETQVNILVNNAGVMVCPKGRTEEGFETQFGTNYLSHFLFTLLLLPKIRSSVPARIVNVSSVAHTYYGINFEDINYERRPYKATEAYSQSKLANILFTRELANKLKEYKIEGINVYSLHPGVIATELGRHLDDTIFPGARWFFRNMASWFIKSPSLGAQTSIYCAIDEKCGNETGLYYSDCVPVKPSKRARNDADAKKLWDMSLNFVSVDEKTQFS